MAIGSGETLSGYRVSNGATLEATSGGTISNITVLGKGFLDITSVATTTGLMLASGGSAAVEINSAAISNVAIEAIAHGVEIVSGGTIGPGAIVKTMSGGTALVLGTVMNSGGTLIASGITGLLEITSGAVVSGGVVKVGNGVVDVLSGGTADVAFVANGNGGLEIADTQSNPTAYTGAVSGFGGVNHANHTQFIDLISVKFGAGVTIGYTSANGANTSGTLAVSSGGHLVASIEMIGTYSAGNFHVGSGISGTVKITDPRVVNGGGVEIAGVGNSGSHTFIDLLNIAFGAKTTLAYFEKSNDSGDPPMATHGIHAAAVALLGNYIAASFVTAADGHGGTLVTLAPQGEQQTLLAYPQLG